MSKTRDAISSGAAVDHFRHSDVLDDVNPPLPAFEEDDWR
jgi:hypothetical protein